MSEPENALSTTGAKPPGPVFVLPGLTLPAQVTEFLMGLLSECNRRISFQLATFPNAHEEALDLMFISHFASMQGAIRFGSHWTVRIDAHYIGGGRHFRTWEVADIGLMAFFDGPARSSGAGMQIALGLGKKKARLDRVTQCVPPDI